MKSIKSLCIFFALIKINFISSKSQEKPEWVNIEIATIDDQFAFMLNIV